MNRNKKAVAFIWFCVIKKLPILNDKIMIAKLIIVGIFKYDLAIWKEINICPRILRYVANNITLKIKKFSILINKLIFKSWKNLSKNNKFRRTQ